MACDPHPNTLQFLQRMKIRLIISEADHLVPMEKPAVRSEDLDSYVALDREHVHVGVEQQSLANFLDVPPDVLDEEEVITSQHMS